MEPSTSRKRPRDQESEPESENHADDSHSLSLEKNLTFSDTLMALRMMRAQFPRIDKVSVQPFILQSQLYSSIKDRTQVDRELESLRRDRVLRVFKLNTGQDDHAIMFIDDYISQIEHVVRRMEEKKRDLTVFEWFQLHVLQSKLDTGIGHEELCSLLSLGGKVKEEHISQLINAGLLRFPSSRKRFLMSVMELENEECFRKLTCISWRVAKYFHTVSKLQISTVLLRAVLGFLSEMCPALSSIIVYLLGALSVYCFWK